MNNKIVLTGAVLAVATVLAVGLTVFPSPVQNAEAQGNPCNIDTLDIEAEEVGNNCDFYGNTEIDASSEGSDLPCIPFPECIRPTLVPIPLDD